MAQVGNIPNFEIIAGNRSLSTFIDTRIGPVEDGRIAMRSAPAPKNLKVGHEFDLPFDVLFDPDEPKPFRFKPIVPVLTQLSELVEGIIERFVKHIGV